MLLSPASLFRLSTVSSLLILVLCACGSDRQESDGFQGRYLAHLELDSTTLLVTELLNGLETPWDINYGSDGWIWINQHNGTISRFNPESGEHQLLHRISDVHVQRSQGLLSMALHPDMEDEPFLWVHYVYRVEEGIYNSRIVRFRFDGEGLYNRTVILDPIPGSRGHNGSRMVIGPDDMLWFAAGDANRPDLAQSPDSYHGKVLRMHPDGSIPDDNPIGRSRIWSSGHRNIQGITFGREHLYVSEHGPDTDDEINRIVRGGNYGWPDVLGFCESESERNYCRDSLVVEPMHAFNPPVAPAGVDYYEHPAIPEWQNALLLTNLRIQALRVLLLNESGTEIDRIGIFFQQHFGRLRDVTTSPDGRIFLATSNMDWYREFRPEIHDPELVTEGDRILMLQAIEEHSPAAAGLPDEPVILREDRVPLYLGDTEIADDADAGEQLYLTHCASCHRPDGRGGEEYAPDLYRYEHLYEEPDRLITGILDGIPDQNGTDYEWAMPAFRNLDDEEVASIANYLLQTFYTHSESIRPERISTLRK